MPVESTAPYREHVNQQGQQSAEAQIVGQGLWASPYSHALMRLEVDAKASGRKVVGPGGHEAASDD